MNRCHRLSTRYNQILHCITTSMRVQLMLVINIIIIAIWKPSSSREIKREIRSLYWTLFILWETFRYETEQKSFWHNNKIKKAYRNTKNKRTITPYEIFYYTKKIIIGTHTYTPHTTHIVTRRVSMWNCVNVDQSMRVHRMRCFLQQSFRLIIMIILLLLYTLC